MKIKRKFWKRTLIVLCILVIALAPVFVVSGYVKSAADGRILSMEEAARLEDVDWLRRALPLEDGDVLLLCSDGVGGVLTRQEVQECLTLKNANDACGALRDAVLGKQLLHQDNFTAVVIRCGK